ncbi:LD-carboxypeptidase [Macrococcus hajekii]|uniref:LD-carboxypeptidase n=1 Tax=Macrococcus hajekii TaxID=198482 RepID=A0A4R6BM67_9STAP|nr:S66 peptidase family protein [Macrococcus hajekii]TDM02747.1 LD-carboxypeptidase [Macrococcus hajekii]GGB03543.1 LD-carboxypeptidase [Macrococcus hajekii]
MIQYPTLDEHAVIGVTAPSSGLPERMHHYLDDIRKRFEDSYEIIIKPSVLTQDKVRSTDSNIRAKELNELFTDDQTSLIIPPFGGELALEIINKIEYDQLKPKWLLGYSDISTVLLAITLKTGIATAHGTNIVDLRGRYSDETTAMWSKVLNTKVNEEVVQYSSEFYQSKWNHSQPSESIFNLDTQTEWKSVNAEAVTIEGRLLGGCVDVINHLIGTPYGDVKAFREKYIKDEPVIWYLENCEVSTVEFRRILVQMQYAGWFDNCSGILFGRTPVTTDTNSYTIKDVYQDTADDLQIPIIYDIDCGHMPPQITFINGAYGIVEYSDGKGKVTQKFI